MRRILWKHIFVKVMTMISLGMVTLLAVYGIFFLLSGGSTEKIIHISSGGIGVLFVNVMGQIGKNMLPGAIFIMPVSRAEREKMVKTMMFAMWGIVSIWFGVMLYVTELLDIVEGEVPQGYEWIDFSLLIASISYLLMYSGYLDKMKSRIINQAQIWGIALFQAFGLAIITELLASDERENVYITVLCVFWILCVAMDVWVHRKHFQTVVSYYAGYESSHHLMEKKVRV